MADDLDIGVILPQWSEQATPDGFRRIAEAADERDYDAVWGGDHIVMPEDIPDDAADWAEIDTPTYDVFTVLSHVAGVTESIRLGTNICVAPIRHPVHLAKLALSLDNLSDGRFELGVAVGWLEAEYEVLDVPFEDRGALTDEFLELFDRACSEGSFSFDGPFHSFERTGFYPRPHGDGIKTWIGGRAGASVRRVGEHGDGWTIGNLEPGELAEQRERLERAWADFERESSPSLAHTNDTYVVREDEEVPDRYADSPQSGSPEAIAESIDAYADAGATRINLRLRGLSIEDRIEQIHRFADEVRPLL